MPNHNFFKKLILIVIVEQSQEIKEFVESINARDFPAKQYENMTIEELSSELRDMMKFEQEAIKKIEEFENNGFEEDLIKYVKIICGNATQREILAIQEVYLEKIDRNYLGSK